VHLCTTQARTLVDRYTSAPNAPSTAAALAVIALAPLAAVALRLLVPTGSGVFAVTWLPAALGGGAALACAAAMLLGVVLGLREMSLPAILRAGGFGALAVGLAVSAVQGVSAPGAFPDPALALCALVSGVLMVASVAAPRSLPRQRGWTVAAMLIGLFVVVDGTLAAALFLAPPAGATGWMLVAAASLTAVSSIGARWLGAGVIAAGFVALAIARPGSIDTLPGILALAAGAVLSAWQDRTQREPVAEPAQLQLAVHAAQPPTPPSLRPQASDARGASEAEAEATRLTRELRGTIAELLQARHTVELQRDEIMRLETQDPLTGLANRRAIIARLAAEVAEARRYAHPVAVLLLDIDGFTGLNREHGMGVGDEVLREVALRLRLRMRAADALGRVGADSFLVLLPHTDETGAATFAEALLERLLSRPIETYDGELAVVVSVGIAFMRPGMTFTDDELLSEADAALASARAAGGNRIAFDRAHGLLRLDEHRHGTRGDTDAGREADSGR
jgi:diguanylate cyclase (GGDEF)-like protein